MVGQSSSPVINSGLSFKQVHFRVLQRYNKYTTKTKITPKIWTNIRSEKSTMKKSMIKAFSLLVSIRKFDLLIFYQFDSYSMIHYAVPSQFLTKSNIQPLEFLLSIFVCLHLATFLYRSRSRKYC